MQDRNADTGFPWAGTAALAAAALALVAALSGSFDVSRLVQTWPLSRATGIVAFGFLWASVVIGLLQSLGLLKGVSSPVANIDLHSFVSLIALYGSLFHAVILLWDHYMPFSLTDVLVPFASSRDRIGVGLGSLSLYIALGVIVTTYLRHRLNLKTWRQIHMTSLLGLGAALLHGLALGTDSSIPAVTYVYRLAAISTLVLLGLRVYKGVASRARPVRGG